MLSWATLDIVLGGSAIYGFVDENYSSWSNRTRYGMSSERSENRRLRSHRDHASGAAKTCSWGRETVRAYRGLNGTRVNDTDSSLREAPCVRVSFHPAFTARAPAALGYCQSGLAAGVGSSGDGLDRCCGASCVHVFRDVFQA